MMTDDCFLSLYSADNLGKHVIYSLYASLRRERRHVSERVIAGGRAVQQVMPVFVFPVTDQHSFAFQMQRTDIFLGCVSEKSFSSLGPSRSTN